MEQENMMNREYFEETPAENILDIRRKNRQQYANDEGDDGTTNLILLSSKRKYEQVFSPESDLLLARESCGRLQSFYENLYRW